MSLFKIDVDHLLNEAKAHIEKENYPLSEYYINLGLLSSEKSSQVLELYYILSCIYYKNSKLFELMSVTKKVIAVLTSGDFEEDDQGFFHGIQAIYNTARLCKDLGYNSITTLYYYKVCKIFITKAKNISREQIEQIQTDINDVFESFNKQLKEIKEKRYDVLNKDQTEFEEHKKDLYTSINDLEKIEIKNIKPEDLQEGESFFLISRGWVKLYKSFLKFLKSIENNVEDYKNFLFTGFDSRRLIDMFMNSDSLDFNACYIDCVRNESFINFEDSLLYENDEELKYTNLFVTNDFFFKINKDQWEALANNFGSDIEVKRVKTHNTLEVFLKRVNFVILDKRLQNHMNFIGLKCAQMSNFSTFGDFVAKIQRILKAQCNADINKEKVKIFKINKSITNIDLFTLIVSHTEDVKFFQDYSEVSHQDSINDVDEKDLFVIYTDENEDNYMVQLNKEKKTCENCKKEIVLNHYYICNENYCGRQFLLYCNEECYSKDKSHSSYHKLLMKYNQKVATVEDLLKIDLSRLLSPGSLHGLVGLTNLGNTCFMNSALQCLSNCVDLTKFFLSKKYEQETNLHNKLGTYGQVAKAYYNLLQNLWNGNKPYLNPKNFRGIFIQFARQFSGYSQQDSHEMLTFMLDKLHEDLSRVTNKPYIEMKNQQEGETDKEASDRWWSSYLRRENSMIVDLFHGQYKSRITCPECGTISITYEPFMYLSLPIPKARYTYSYKFFPLLKNGNDHLYKVYDVLMTKNFTCEEFKSKFIIASQRKSLTHETIELVLFDKRKKIVKICKDNEYLFPYVSEGVHEICLYETEKGKQNIYCYLCKYEISSSFFGLVPYEKIDYYFLYPLAISVGPKDKVENIYENINVNIIKRLGLLPENHHKREDIKNLVNSFSGLTVSKEHMMNFILRLINAENIKDYCDFCGSSLKNLHTCLFLSRFSQNETYSYMKKCISHLNTPLILNIQLLLQPKGSKLLSQSSGINDMQLTYDLSNTVNVYDCLNLFCSEEKLEKDNMWYCSKCKKHQEAFKKMDIYKAPHYLIIQLKRFKRGSGTSFLGFDESKNSKLVNFPINDLDLSSFCLDKSNTRVNYDLVAVSQHYGGISFGHYTAVAKNNNGWYCFNDTSVSQINESEIATDAAYILFYKLK